MTENFGKAIELAISHLGAEIERACCNHALSITFSRNEPVLWFAPIDEICGIEVEASISLYDALVECGTNMNESGEAEENPHRVVLVNRLIKILNEWRCEAAKGPAP